MNDVMIRIDNVSKQYRLGQIGGTTLREEIQRISASIRHKEDPTKKIGEKEATSGEVFNALSNVSFEVKRGERVGIIGHNGAGKSTLLKLISHVTAPTEGFIGLNGRVTSMLEVGTGFHGELTGRENIYMNGAILGMTRKEIDSKMEDIIDFSECRQFIDTPVKRYSSGMYVKLAFSVAAHLDSEIMIMDEVLAVGDMAFQKKCLEKMNSVSKKDGRTILYVSHNMNTIRQLCDRCVVMEKGRAIYNGNVEKAIDIYLDKGAVSYPVRFDYSKMSRMDAIDIGTRNVIIESLQIKNKDEAYFVNEQRIAFEIRIKGLTVVKSAIIRMEITTLDDAGVCAAFSNEININQGINNYEFDLDISQIVTGEYKVIISVYKINEYGIKNEIDAVAPAFYFKIERELSIEWLHRYWGNIKLPNLKGGLIANGQ